MSTPDPPPWLDADERQIWAHYAPLLAADGRLSARSLDTLARYCLAVVQVRALRLRLRDVPAVLVCTVFDRQGNDRVIMKSHPLDAMLRAWMECARALESDLLLQPLADLRAPRPAPLEVDPFAEECALG